MMAPSEMVAWECGACTFTNEDVQRRDCQLCMTERPVRYAIVLTYRKITAQNQLQTSARTVVHEPVSCIVRSVSTDRQTHRQTDSQTDGRINLGGAG